MDQEAQINEVPRVRDQEVWICAAWIIVGALCQ